MNAIYSQNFFITLMFAVQFLMGIFLYVNSLLIFTFFKKEIFRTSNRYILFSHTLICDSMFLVVTNIFFTLDMTQTPIPPFLCIILCGIAVNLHTTTPLTLTAMSVERYVAICMPLRHAELATLQKAGLCILIIHAISSILTLTVLFMFLATASLNFYAKYLMCNAELLAVYKWQGHVRSIFYLVYFIVMTVTIVFTYISIVQVAKKASADKKATSKARKTVLLHAFQLFLSLIQMLCPFLEQAVLEIDVNLYISLRTFDYIVFLLAPRCLSPLIYGLRDEHFYLVLKYYALWGLNKKMSPVIVDL
uniref:G-protein coupled receptors family 1 profile domain-containing protein n=2 Tax=Scleropages formosus TaxID=113540 RepID=A0A8C9R8Z7_SCLFO